MRERAFSPPCSFLAHKNCFKGLFNQNLWLPAIADHFALKSYTINTLNGGSTDFPVPIKLSIMQQRTSLFSFTTDSLSSVVNQAVWSYPHPFLPWSWTALPRESRNGWMCPKIIQELSIDMGIYNPKLKFMRRPKFLANHSVFSVSWVFWYAWEYHVFGTFSLVWTLL